MQTDNFNTENKKPRVEYARLLILHRLNETKYLIRFLARLIAAKAHSEGFTVELIIFKL